MKQIVGTAKFINKLTANKLTNEQTNRAVAFLKKEGIVFYDDWSREHCSLLDTLHCNKTTVINALNAGTKHEA